MKCIRQWLNEAKASFPAEKDYIRLFQKWQCREERKGEWYFPFAKSKSGNPICLLVSVRGQKGRLQFHIGCHFYECSCSGGRFAAGIADGTEIHAKVLRQGEDSYGFFESFFPFAVRTKDFGRIAKAAAEGTSKASAAWHDKNDEVDI